MVDFKKAKRTQRKFKGGIIGISGSGKTWTALEIGTGLADGGKICLLDTEQSSAELYADDFDFDHANLTDTSVKSYKAGIKAAIDGGYSVLIIDSLSHAWEYLLEEHERVQARSQGKLNSFTAWKYITPIYQELIKAIVSAPIHILATMRAKSDWVLEESEGNNGRKKTTPKKVGMAAIFRQGGEYEFDWIGNIDLEHRMITEKTRLKLLADEVILKPDRELGKKIGAWLQSAPEAEPVIDTTNLEWIELLNKKRDFVSLGQRVIKTRCTMQGVRLLDVMEKHFEWVESLLASPSQQEKMDPVDLKAIVYLYKHLTEPKGEQTNV